jgi:hypothetical protein
MSLTGGYQRLRDFYPEDEGHMSVQDVGNHTQFYTAPQPRRSHHHRRENFKYQLQFYYSTVHTWSLSYVTN